MPSILHPMRVASKEAALDYARRVASLAVAVAAARGSQVVTAADVQAANEFLKTRNSF